MGGLMSLYAVTAYNEVFSRAAALSPCLWIGDMLHRLLAETSLCSPTMVYMDIGTGELQPGENDQLAELFEVAADLTRAGAQAAARVIPGAEHCEAEREKRIPVFMDYLLGEQI